MADGLNNARAMRIAEIVNDFRTVQNAIAAIRANPSAEDYNEEGFAVLRRCVQESQVLLIHPFQATLVGSASDEQNKQHLKRIILDATIRRFQARKQWYIATAALRWINARNTLLQGHRPNATHAAALAHLRNALRQDIAAASDSLVFNSMQSADRAEGKWLDEDPSLATIQHAISLGYTGVH